MATYTLNVHVDENQLKFLKDGGYTLCLAKQANGQYTVVWKGDVEYLQENEFQWQEVYQVFGSNDFKVTESCLPPDRKSS